MAKTIMIVDDSFSARQAISLFLRDEGYQVVEAIDGKDALRKAGETAIDMVITDINMPNMDGITLIRELRRLPAFKFIPIIIQTTEFHSDRKQEGKAAGATGWVVKPFHSEQLLGVIKKMFG
ncbi:MAG: response regulator [Magnetococcales bacterium]|nr:response regulator [Magnetococcales bacterium]